MGKITPYQRTKKQVNADDMANSLSKAGTSAIDAGAAAQRKDYVGATLSGAAAGAGLGATVGSFVPVIGTAIGGLVGAGVGAIAGAAGTALAPEEKTNPLADESTRLQNEIMQQKVSETKRKNTWDAKFKNALLYR